MAKSGTGKRPKLPPCPEEIRRTSTLLAEELLNWPGVSVRPMFGMRAFYRGTVIFAMLPDKRALENPRVNAFKLRSSAPGSEGPKWQLFELREERDASRALACLDEAYRRARRGDRE